MKLLTYFDGVGRESAGYMTRNQALKLAERTMPKDLKRAGFVAGVFESDPIIHGAHYYRIGYGKA